MSLRSLSLRPSRLQSSSMIKQLNKRTMMLSRRRLLVLTTFNLLIPNRLLPTWRKLMPINLGFISNKLQIPLRLKLSKPTSRSWLVIKRNYHWIMLQLLRPMVIVKHKSNLLRVLKIKTQPISRTLSNKLPKRLNRTKKQLKMQLLLSKTKRLRMRMPFKMMKPRTLLLWNLIRQLTLPTTRHLLHHKLLCQPNKVKIVLP